MLKKGSVSIKSQISSRLFGNTPFKSFSNIFSFLREGNISLSIDSLEVLGPQVASESLTKFVNSARSVFRLNIFEKRASLCSRSLS